MEEPGPILAALAGFPRVAMKLSGVFSEVGEMDGLERVEERVAVWVRRVVEAFGAGRVMWGSDWPVCNVGFARFGVGAWGVWRGMVERILAGLVLEGAVGEMEAEGIWGEIAARVYGV